MSETSTATTATTTPQVAPLSALLSTPLQTRFRVQFDTGNVDIVFADPAPNNREKAPVIGYIIRNIGLSLTVIAKMGIFGVRCDYQPPQDLPGKLGILGSFDATGRVNEWEIRLVNPKTESAPPKYTLEYNQVAPTDTFDDIIKLFE